MMFGFSDTDDDIDVYTFQGSGSRTLVVDVDAELFLAEMDAVVELYDDRGGYLFGVDDADGLDPRFNILLPYTGRLNRSPLYALPVALLLVALGLRVVARLRRRRR